MNKTEQFIAAMAQWEKDRRSSNRGQAKDDKAPAMSALTGEQLETAISKGRIEVAS